MLIFCWCVHSWIPESYDLHWRLPHFTTAHLESIYTSVAICELSIPDNRHSMLHQPFAHPGQFRNWHGYCNHIWVWDISLCHHVQTDSGDHPNSYPMGTESYFYGVTVAIPPIPIHQHGVVLNEAQRHLHLLFIFMWHTLYAPSTWSLSTNT